MARDVNAQRNTNTLRSRPCLALDRLYLDFTPRVCALQKNAADATNAATAIAAAAAAAAVTTTIAIVAIVGVLPPTSSPRLSTTTTDAITIAVAATTVAFRGYQTQTSTDTPLASFYVPSVFTLRPPVLVPAYPRDHLRGI